METSAGIGDGNKHTLLTTSYFLSPLKDVFSRTGADTVTTALLGLEGVLRCDSVDARPAGPTSREDFEEDIFGDKPCCPAMVRGTQKTLLYQRPDDEEKVWWDRLEIQ